MPGRTVLTLAAVAAVTVIFTATAPAADRPDARDSGAAGSSYLHTVEPSVLRPGDTLTLAGVIENTGDEPLYNVQALPRWNTVQLETRDEIPLIADDPSVRWGFRYDDPFQVVAERLGPGQSAEYRLDIDAEQLSFGSPGVYAVGVDIRGSASDGERLTLDTSRTVLPWIPEEPSSTVQVALFWPVEAPPSLLPDGGLGNDALAARISPGGSLDAMVDGAGSSPVTWLVDPDVLDTVDAMSTNSDGDAAAAAQSWRSTFDAATGGHLYVLPYARPDLAALRAVDPPLAARLATESVDAARQAVASQSGARTGVARPDASADPGILAILAEAGVRTIVMSATAATPANHPLAQLDTPEGELDVVLTDPGLDGTITDAYNSTNTEAGLLELRQRWAAETAMATLQADVRGGSVVPMVAAPPARWTPDEELTSAIVDVWTSLPWVDPVTVDELDAPAQRAMVAPNPGDPVNTLPAENITAAGELDEAVRRYTDLLAEPDPAQSRALGLAALRAASTGWRDDPAAGLDYASEISDELTERLDGVHVTVPESVTLSSRTGIFPLTVTNDLDEPVTVKLAIQAANPDRLRIDDVPEQWVDAGSRETIEIKAEAATNGRVPITVQLVTPSGAALGPATQAVVHATDYGAIGWIIIAGAGALFGAAMIRAMLRRRNASDDEPDQGHEDVPEPAQPNEPTSYAPADRPMTAHTPEVSR
ncbi:DUF6049 family protein [Phytoactinopolyspora limicola]|uniref:DUF6049 family protein n=1 Tax=Phytoactinopolyspora limicola TaxID=2715536 RepID=UPI0014072FFB|nr:DUF6049 family protein [Phytoactinopolyspora limicola]